MTTTTAPANANPPAPAAARAPQFRINQRDQLSALLTIIVTLIALLLGLLLRNSVEARTKAYADPSGVSIQYPDQWRLNTSEASAGLLVARDDSAPGYPATFEMRWLPADPQAADEEVLANAANTLALNRGRDLAAFQLFEIAGGENVKDLPGAKASYVFVDTSGGAFQERLPAVVLGEDLLARKGNRVYVFSMLATEADRPGILPLFRAFVESAKLP